MATKATKNGGSGIIESYGRDDSSMPLSDKESMNGREMGGSTTNLGHSLTGGKAVQQVKKGGN